MATPESLDNYADESGIRKKNAFGISDVFFWRDAPDWYFKTFTSAGFFLSYSVLQTYLNRDELEVFMPPRAKVLPESMRVGYRNTQMFKSALVKTGRNTSVVAAASAIYFGGAYYLGEHLGSHTWHNFAASGAAAGQALALWMIWPPKLRTVAFGTALGASLGMVSGYATQAVGVPFWNLDRDFEGWWWGKFVDLKADKLKLKEELAAKQEQLAK
mmetsp:Transcript_11651/g.20665  ORF Transcript_11651/g.20665 Transcript_11651/m.20665 type:complete len:215 (+) Transcript_11651:152-796(+)